METGWKCLKILRSAIVTDPPPLEATKMMGVFLTNFLKERKRRERLEEPRDDQKENSDILFSLGFLNSSVLS